MLTPMDMYFVYAAGIISFFTALLHLFGGSPEFAKPLQVSNDLSFRIRATLWMCWHMVTFSLFAIPLIIYLYVWCGDIGYLMSAIILNTAIGLAAFMSNIVLRAKFSVLFQGFLFLPVTVLLLLAI